MPILSLEAAEAMAGRVLAARYPEIGRASRMKRV